MEARCKRPYWSARVAREQGATLVKIISGEQHAVPDFVNRDRKQMQFILHVEDVVTRRKFYTGGSLNLTQQLEAYCRNLFYPEEIQGLFLEARRFERDNSRGGPATWIAWSILGKRPNG